MEILLVLLSIVSLFNALAIGEVDPTDAVADNATTATEEVDLTGGVSEDNKLKTVDTYKMLPCGMKVQDQDKIFWKYYGKTTAGKFFDAGTFTATIGAGHVIKGVDEGMKGLCVGDKRTMTMHSSWGYGVRGTGGIPGNANLVFDVELLSLERPGMATETIEGKLHRTGGVSKENKLKIADALPTGQCKIKISGNDVVNMYFHGYLLDGKLFDSGEYDGAMGTDEFIPGVDQGIRGLCVGDQRSLTIHPDWGFGEEGTDVVPPNTVIIMDVKILNIQRHENSSTEGINPRTGLKPDQKMKIETIQEAKNCTLRSGTNDKIFWKYRGTLLDGTEFHKGTFEATLGHNHVIQGVDRGMRAMCVGEKRRLTIHSDWAYGHEGRPGSIPPRATLVFDVELMKIERPVKDEL